MFVANSCVRVRVCACVRQFFFYECSLIEAWLNRGYALALIRASHFTTLTTAITSVNTTVLFFMHPLSSFLGPLSLVHPRSFFGAPSLFPWCALSQLSQVAINFFLFHPLVCFRLCGWALANGCFRLRFS